MNWEGFGVMIRFCKCLCWILVLRAWADAGSAGLMCLMSGVQSEGFCRSPFRMLRPIIGIDCMYHTGKDVYTKTGEKYMYNIAETVVPRLLYDMFGTARSLRQDFHFRNLWQAKFALL
jgi:hypothetical protein